MRIFSRARPEAAPREDPITTLLRLLVETEKHPLKRIPPAGLDGEAKEIAERLNTRLDALASAEKEQQQFIADVSHELRTPLTVLRGTLEVVLEEDRPAEEYREAIGDALRVTIVATGLGGAAAQRAQPVMQMVQRTGTDNEPVNYEELDQPTAIRRERTASTAPIPASAANPSDAG